MTTKIDLRGLLPEELAQLAAELGEASYRGRQLFHWLHRRRATSLEAMTELPGAFRARLAGQAVLPPVEVINRRVAAGGLTRKLLLRLADGELIECVLMSYEDGRRRQTACLSSQVGCAMGCTFCATGQGGFRRNLTPGEIVLQALALVKDVQLRDPEARLSNIVFMGMGEPLLNYRAVLKAVRIFEHPQGWGISHRRITISTCGLVPQIRQLAGEKPPLELAVSLHAATNELRERLMPINRRYPLEELIPACRHYGRITGRRVTFEYALIAGVNDRREDAGRLVELLQGVLAFVNLIPLNPVPGSPYKGVSRAKAWLFASWLQKAGLAAAVRESRGQDIAAACGQLRSNAGREVF
ncbi:MAG: rRNA (adenine2503-C2)-methyltransferase [Moorella sp. (in: firmicutes)]|jgi:23S rRNA (adenine2503-C2)-methyltransferase|uniref:23S rRNA (adenine(2503)-C(2))-methyltransferase RlmN n=1 Tax=unclassified Neomoorella TaxID=2676739 RepID=UPI0010FFB167|nr:MULTISPECIES: 23S rRNA (adenine(2503)-C(2))-methyltransferase RlmN [unclassified Moorella (in: firmicutes)]MDK2815639.1 rRNA (adenine2503-C2)-methyltransferase [Moorella sp. (in: firmicutes)]MDK2894175.1 rRNA (adenine2503-C2)-methyltransferase [Moorella sp. (in: firmicutes)]GEA15088.1 putative dual-specificity RNA methyltransferase RlmN [Moorella sp. E308F]GEA17001.1 putative dual-specificity RNA methyltransferase RlmN [Moorella sp. E306M]